MTGMKHLVLDLTCMYFASTVPTKPESGGDSGI